MNNFHVSDSETVRITVASALRRHTGFGKAMSVQELAERSGIPVSTIKSFRAAAHTPSLPNFIAMSRALPATFDDTILHLAGKGGVTPLAEDDGCPIEAGKASAEVTSATMGLIRKSGGICQHEVRKIIPMAQNAVRRLSSFIRRHGREA